MAGAAQGLGQQRRGAQRQPHAHDQESEEQIGAQRPRRQFARPQPAHHQGVGGADGDLRQIGQDQRPAKGQRRRHLGAPGMVSRGHDRAYTPMAAPQRGPHSC